jgi:glycosyltransferase involved in cell wall biosynthesis
MKDLFLPDAPLVSIVISTYNRAALIGESIQSVLEQTYTNWEMIIVDDGSSDNTREIVQGFKDERISFYYVEHSGLLGKVRNIGLRKAIGDLIAFQDSDDLWRPDKLEYQIRLLKQYPKAAYVLSNNNQFGSSAIQTPEYDAVYVGNLFLPMMKEARFHFCGTSLIFNREVFREIGFLEESIPMMREIHFFFRMSQRFTGIFTNERLVNVRRHPHNTSNTYTINAQLNTLKMLQEFYEEKALSKQEFAALAGACYYRMGLFFFNKNDFRNAIRNFWKYSAMNPLQYKGWIRLAQAFLKTLSVANR